MTAFLVFLALGMTAWLVSEWLDGRDHRDARQRNHARRVR